MKKDFLFFTWSFVKNAHIYFKHFESLGYECDFVTEKDIMDFDPSGKSYKNVFVYLQDSKFLQKINHCIENHFFDANIIQHDDTDEENIQVWLSKAPDLVMQRELTENSNNPYGCPVEPFHFPMPSIYDPTIEKSSDVFFYACLSNPRRLPFIRHMQHLSSTSLSDLKCDFRFTHVDQRTPEDFKISANKAKIGLHYFGNSYDSHRIWELASCKTAILMPELRLKSTSKDYMYFSEYETMEDDFSDVEFKIRYLLDDDRWKSYAEDSHAAYNKNHSPEKCCEHYEKLIRRHVKLD